MDLGRNGFSHYILACWMNKWLGSAIEGVRRACSIAIDASRRGESVTLGVNEVVGDRSELWMN